MRLKLLRTDELRPRLESAYGSATLPESGPAKAGLDLFEVVRCELSALGSISRRVLLDRVLQRLEPIGAVSREHLLEVTQGLEASGDILRGPGGQVAPAPLRLVRLTGDVYLVVGSVPARILESHITPHTVIPGQVRRVRVEPNAPQELMTQIEAMGGRILSVEWWSGLERTPAADESWLESIERRLQDQEPAAADLDSADWRDVRCYVPAQDEPLQHRRWKRLSASDGGRLIRADQPGGWKAYAWEGPTGAAEASRRLRLSRDEACRTMFALDTRAGAPLRLEAHAGTTSRGATTMDIVLSLQLPFAEYRYLLAMSKHHALSDQQPGKICPVRLQVPVSAWPVLSGTLRDRLHVEIHETREES